MRFKTTNWSFTIIVHIMVLYSAPPKRFPSLQIMRDRELLQSQERWLLLASISMLLEPSTHHLKSLLLLLLNVLIGIIPHNSKSMRHTIKNLDLVLNRI